MKDAHPKVLKAIEDFRGYLVELPTCTPTRHAEIYREAVACYDLMNYSYEVANTKHPTWRELDAVVMQVHQLLWC